MNNMEGVTTPSLTEKSACVSPLFRSPLVLSQMIGFPFSSVTGFPFASRQLMFSVELSSAVPLISS